MKEKIINFLKSKTQLEEKFIILGLLCIITMNVMTIFRTFDLFTFFGIYFYYKHLLSTPAYNKNRWLISCVIIVILILEGFTLINYVFFILNKILNFFDREKYGLEILISLFLFLIYWITIRIKSNPNKISETFKTIFCEYFQLFAVVIFYIYATHLIVQRYELPYIITLMIINLTILTSTNILSKKTSTILEILCFGYLFLALTFFSIPTKKEFISPENKVAIFLVILNFISFAIVFLKNKNYAEKIKILLLALLMISFFFADKAIVCSLYFIATFIIIRFIIVYEKLSTLNASSFFTLLITAVFFISLPLTVGRGGGVGDEFVETSFLQLIILPIIIFFSNRTLKKRKLKNDIRNLKIN